MISTKYGNLKWWQIAILAVGVSAIGGLASGLPKRKEKKVYKVTLKQAPWSPPAWVFGPAWTINNFFLLIGLQKILQSDMTEKKKLLILQGIIWTIFFSFGYIYFNKKSPVLAAIWTLSDTALAGASMLILKNDKEKISIFYLPLFLWTLFASSLAVYQALENKDPILG